MLKIKNKADNTAEIIISGDIIDDADGDFLSSVWGVESGYEWPAKIKQQLDELKGKDLTIYINSDGGMINAGVAMANMIARHDGHTTAIVDGWCCSIATQIFFAADERKMPENAYLMIHKPTVALADGNSYDLRKMAETLDTLQEGLETTYRRAAREGIADDYIHDMVNDETWLTGKEASEIFNIELMEPVSAVACAGKRFVNSGKAPKGLRFSARDKPKAEEEPIKPEPSTDKPVDVVDNIVDKCQALALLAKLKGVSK